jgi:hypothetical protein
MIRVGSTFNPEILILRDTSELNSTQAGNNIFHGPLASENIEKLEARRTHIDTLSDGVGDDSLVVHGEESWIEEVGMIG